MPLLTVALAVHGEQAWINEFAESVLGQEPADVELLAIDDASPGHAPALLDALAERDPRVRVEHVAERLGPGAARDLALELASGDFVWFANTTDRLRPAAVIDRLAADAPDVLALHHERVATLGKARPGPHRKLLARAAKEGPGAFVKRRYLADTARTAWDKVFRTAFLRELGVRFGQGHEADLTVTWPALVAAQRIGALAEPVYERREPDNATPVPGSPLDVFDQYDAVFAAIGDSEREAVVRAMLRHELDLLAGAGDRREFFRRMSQGYRRHGAGVSLGGGRLAGVRTALIARDLHAGYRLLEAALAKRHALKQRGGARAERRRKADRERHYRAQLEKPIDPDLAVFSAYWSRAYSCNPRAIYERARELVPEMRGVWVMHADAVGKLPAGVDHVVHGSPEYFETMARARYLVNNVNWANNIVKRTGSAHVMTHHGTPLKVMGMDQRHSPISGARMDMGAFARRCRRWDYSVSSNAFSTLVWERTFPFAYETLEVGYPRNDVLANATDEDVRRARAAFGIEPGQTAVLYAPTHRDWNAEYVPVLDVAAVADALGPDHVLLSRQHYFYGAATPGDGVVRDVSAHPVVEDLYLAADVLVTDYSSAMFDYAVLDRPIVIHAPDWELYRTLRGVYFDLMAEPPGVVTTSEDGVVGALQSGATGDELRAPFRARFCALDDGRAAERVVRRVWLGEQLPAATPEPVVVG
jgi:CDP-glycerol glycerophosphotransferase (TagB/SpsB family)/glycosyltransferase involved in cell wall biosynthesis